MQTPADGWCGDWAGGETPRAPTDTTPPAGLATHRFLARVAPSLSHVDPAALLDSLLSQITPDVRCVIIRMNGLDGRPLTGLKQVAREFRMSQGQLRALLAAGEGRLAEAVWRLAVQQEKQ